MLHSTYTLQRIARDLDARISGLELLTCFSQVRSTLICGFASPSDEVWLEIDVSGALSTLFVHEQFNRAKHNTIDLFPNLIGQKVKRVVQPENERVVVVEFDTGSTMTCVCFGRISDNVFVHHKGKVTSLNSEGESPEFGSRPSLPLEPDSSDSIKKHVQTTRTLLGSPLVTSICTHIGVAPSTSMSALSEQQFVALVQAIGALKHHIQTAPTPWCVDGEHEFALTSSWERECRHQPQELYRGIAKVVLRNRGVASIKSERESTHRSLVRKLNKIRKLAGDIHEQDILQRAERYRMFGHILLGQPNSSVRGEDTLETQDYENNSVVIPLKSKLSLSENAQTFFEKAKKSERELQVRRKRQQQAAQELDHYEQALVTLESVHGYKALQKFYTQYPEFKPRMQDQGNSTAQYREFDLGEGYTLYVGKDAASNDRLTLKFAKPHDIWLHARGCSGSHCILRGGAKDKKPPRYILEAAAEIAAYYSKARNGKHVPVAWTRKKYVRKPKGANIGAVVIDRETVVQVDPKLPES